MVGGGDGDGGRWRVSGGNGDGSGVIYLHQPSGSSQPAQMSYILGTVVRRRSYRIQYERTDAANLLLLLLLLDTNGRRR